MTSTVPSMICPTLAVQENQMFHEPSLSRLFCNCQSTVGTRSDHHSSSQPESYENDLKRTKTVRTVVLSGIVDAHIITACCTALHAQHGSVPWVPRLASIFASWSSRSSQVFADEGPKDNDREGVAFGSSLGFAVSIDTRKTQLRSDIEDLSAALRAPSVLASKTHKCYTS
jgi:hypothetical protein